MSLFSRLVQIERVRKLCQHARENAAKSLAEISATLEAARSKEEARYTRYGELAETKRAVQSAVMWQLM